MKVANIETGVTTEISGVEPWSRRFHYSRNANYGVSIRGYLVKTCAVPHGEATHRDGECDPKRVGFVGREPLHRGNWRYEHRQRVFGGFKTRRSASEALAKEAMKDWIISNFSTFTRL